MKKIVFSIIMLLLVSCASKNTNIKNNLEIPPFLQQNEN